MARLEQAHPPEPCEVCLGNVPTVLRVRAGDTDPERTGPCPACGRLGPEPSLIAEQVVTSRAEVGVRLAEAALQGDVKVLGRLHYSPPRVSNG